ncbi:mismatch-specific DNA-glycosylase [Arthrobacter sp. AOP36-A1-22]|uniref:mismatch-specific DNA-glycosylase n=1 Tax=Arthrobacter sp. AOP36-A1-22 TaxID=3457684 RepID=UPI0026507761|nr:mismatch-specific DNA-glycosylase [Micrococcaceae bacterium]MDN5813962.1 mismatch-specific DNA-glycosylase [Micrococcaceae bacterium]MDN5825284.1 mismatch-specific DNA-glycosylase [Micrococcaceae bacterium]MDN5880320.1 mismatch-specific DNA-glycosylase [Micrococcaceae bacterium]MDN6171080.1 mismatch-specific DNA-glycosylase [Micrococcaceae bacterium]
MQMRLAADWTPWRSESPLGGKRPTKTDVAHAAHSGLGREDVLPYPADRLSAGMLRLLIVGINPSPWTAAVNAPFARPGNRFWTSLALAGVLDRKVDASRGLAAVDERMLAERGLGITNMVERTSARADELTTEELRAGGARLVERVRILRPRAVGVLGVTAYRVAFSQPRATLGLQTDTPPEGWPEDVQLWVLPNPSGLNAHETAGSLALKWEDVWHASA